MALGLLALIVTVRSLEDADRLARLYRPLTIALAVGAVLALVCARLGPAPWLLALLVVAILSAAWLFAVTRLLELAVGARERVRSIDPTRRSNDPIGGTQSLWVVTEGLAGSGRVAWSPDGWLVFFDQSGCDLCATHPDGTGKHRIASMTPDSTAGFGFGSWNPDGSRIAFQRDRTIVVAQADGSDAVALTAGVADDEFVDWSPDGNWLVFERFSGESPSQLWIMRADGSDARRISARGSVLRHVAVLGVTREAPLSCSLKCSRSSGTCSKSRCEP